ncbi:MAG: TonB-dependent receptor [Pyrinomonadaceae bacterium]|nr:TonB-dependent receptor [Sphingobacteriaceae bacterium]
MKHNLIIRTLGLFIFLSLITSQIFAQANSGKIIGKITDRKTGETLIGLTVKVLETAKGTSTDVEGRYTFNNLTSGNYTLEFSYVGYSGKKVSDVVVTAGKITTLDVVMEEAGQQLQQVTINVTAKAENTSALYSTQKASVRVSDGISAEQIKRSPDRNTGEVLKRVSGTSIQDNKFVVVRGLSDRYNTTLMNNAPLPSSEPDRKAFSFDIVPSNLIDQIVINKTAAADLPGDFAGGVIQMKTKDFPDQKVLDFTYSTGYNSLSTFNDFKSGQSGKYDFLSFDDGSRDLPSSFPSSRKNFINSSPAQKTQLSQRLNNSWGSNSGQAIPTQGFQLNFGNSFMLKNENKVGMLLSLTYRNSNTLVDQRRADYDALGGVGKDYTFDYQDDVYTKAASLGGLANFSYSFKKSKVSLKTLYNRSFEDSYTERVGQSYEEPNFDQRNSQIQLTEKSLFNSTLEGQHSLGKRDYKLDWNFSFSTSNRDQPDLRRIYYTRSLNTNEPFLAAVPIGSGSPKNAGRFYQELQDYIYGGAVNFSMPFKWNDKSQSLKLGVWNQSRTRSYDFRQFGYIIANSASFNQSYLSLPQDQIFASSNIGPSGFIIDEITDPRNKYDASGLLNAGYAMMTNDLLPKVKLNWGVRAESYLESLNPGDTDKANEVDNNYFDILPSANLIFSYSGKTNMRLSYSNTVARAEFRELAAFPFFDFETNNVMKGNPNLKRSRIDNYDLRWEHYPSSGQILSVSGFYKNFTDAIEQVFELGSTAASKTITYQNAQKASLYGMEFEARQKLGFLGKSSKWDNLTAYANLSLIKSDVNLDRAKYPNNNDSRSLQGQSPYLINGGLSYASNGWNLNALYNRIGRRINVVGFGQYKSNGDFQYDYPDIYENPRDVIDFQISRRLMRSKAELKLSINDILNQESVLYQDVNQDKKYSDLNDQTIASRQYGSNFNLAFNYKF